MALECCREITGQIVTKIRGNRANRHICQQQLACSPLEPQFALPGDGWQTHFPLESRIQRVVVCVEHLRQRAGGNRLGNMIGHVGAASLDKSNTGKPVSMVLKCSCPALSQKAGEQFLGQEGPTQKVRKSIQEGITAVFWRGVYKRDVRLAAGFVQQTGIPKIGKSVSAVKDDNLVF